ncbi:hypothetical protein Lpp70_14195, partial [Lacticaseibacillus paracasei subsp. paracasei Lpp70]
MDFRKISRNPNFYQIRPRLYNYGFLHDIFYDELYLTVVSTKMLKPNTQHLDSLFFKPRNLAIDHHVVLGLRKVNENDGYVPVTLHEVKSLGRLRTCLVSFEKYLQEGQYNHLKTAVKG